MPTDRQGLTIVSVDQLNPRPQSTQASRQLLADEREAARLALHRVVTREVAEADHEKELSDIIDMLGLRLSQLDIDGGYDRRTPRRPNLTSQAADGGYTYPGGTRKAKRKA